MKKIELTAPELAFVIATRAALAFGVGLLVAPRLSDERRRMVGRSLIVLGALTTIPAAMAIFGKRPEEGDSDRASEGRVHAEDGENAFSVSD